MAITDTKMLHTCVWCKNFIKEDDLGITTDHNDGETRVYFEHRGKCPGE